MLQSNHDGGDTMRHFLRKLWGAYLVVPAAILVATAIRVFGYMGGEEFLITVLVVITAYSGYQASRTVAEMKKARQAEIYPFLKLTIVRGRSNHIFMRIVNIGKGAARDIDVKYWLEGLENAERSWNILLLMPGEYREFPIPTGKDSDETSVVFFAKESRILKMEARYKTTLEEKKPGKEKEPYKDEIDIKKWIEKGR